MELQTEKGEPPPPLTRLGVLLTSGGRDGWMDEQMDVELVISEDARHYKVFLVFTGLCVCVRALSGVTANIHTGDQASGGE